MKKQAATILKPYEGPLEDLIAFGAMTVTEKWIVKFQGKTLILGHSAKNDLIHNSEGFAKRALREHIEANYCQGHYWHKGKKNTFAKEMGWMRNNGNTGASRADFKKFAYETTDWLLEQKIFTIEKIQL